MDKVQFNGKCEAIFRNGIFAILCWTRDLVHATKTEPH
jgi:hypothetical protein